MHADRQQDLLQIDPPVVADIDAQRIAREFYGLEAKARQLTGERDLNFVISDDHGIKRVLKIANAGEEAAILDFQISALRHLAGTECAAVVQKSCRRHRARARSGSRIAAAGRILPIC